MYFLQKTFYMSIFGYVLIILQNKYSVKFSISNLYLCKYAKYSVITYLCKLMSVSVITVQEGSPRSGSERVQNSRTSSENGRGLFSTS